MLVDQPGRTALGRADLHQPQGTERQRHLLADHAAVERDQFQAAAAEIADEAVGAGSAGQHAHGRQPRLLLPADDADGQAGAAADGIDEGGAVAGVAHGGGGDHVEPADTHALGQRGEAFQRGKPLDDAVGVQQARLLHAAAEAAQHLLVEQGERRTGQPVMDDETDRVGADVDHADTLRRTAGRPIPVGGNVAWNGGRANVLAHTQTPVTRPQVTACSMSRGGVRLLLSALPRPDRLGLVIK